LLGDDESPTVHRGSAAVAAPVVARPRDRAVPPPFDIDAT